MPQGPEEWYKGCEEGLPLLKKYYKDQTPTIFNEDYCAIPDSLITYGVRTLPVLPNIMQTPEDDNVCLSITFGASDLLLKWLMFPNS